MSEVIFECKLARNYALENVAGSLAYLLVKATPNPSTIFGSLPLNLGLLIDVSASMKGNKIAYAKEASKFVVESLSHDDMVSVVIFSDDARAIVPHTNVMESDSILSAIDRIRPVSGTRMHKGIEAAVTEMHKASGLSCINLLIILTDGETEGEQFCLDLAQKGAKNKIVISTFGIGDTYNEELLKSMADVTLGEIFHLQAADQIKRHFEDEVNTARNTVITNATLQLNLANNVKLEEMHRIFPSSTKLQPDVAPSGNVNTVDINNLRINETSCFGIKMLLPARASGSVREAQIMLRYDVPNFGSTGNTEECNMIVEYTNDRDLCSKIDREVISYFNQLNVEILINQAINETKVGNVSGATKILSQAQMLTQRIGNTALTKIIVQASDELNERGIISPGITKTIKVGASHTVKIDN